MLGVSGSKCCDPMEMYVMAKGRRKRGRKEAREEEGKASRKKGGNADKGGK